MLKFVKASVETALTHQCIVIALLHNAVVNRQRQNALNSFTGLYSAASEAHRSVIIEHAARLIFSPIGTGLTRIQASELSVVGSVADSAEKVAKAGSKLR